MLTAPPAPPNADTCAAPAPRDVPADFAQRLTQKGFAVVPRHPTRRMLEAGRLAGNGDSAMAAAIFAAMMEAAD